MAASVTNEWGIKGPVRLEPQEGEKRFFSYQRVDGLEAIWVGIGEIPEASFVFKTVEKAEKCREAIQFETLKLHGIRSQYTDDRITDLIEVLRGSNLSKEDDARVVSVYAKTMGTLGKPIQTTHQLLDRVGNAALWECGISPQINDVPIHAVDSHLYQN